MNTKTAKLAGERLLQGAFQRLNERLGKDFEYVAQAPRELHAALLQKLLESFPVALEARSSAEITIAAMLFNTAAAARLAAMEAGEESAPESLDENQTEMLEVLAQDAFAGGLELLAENTAAPDVQAVVLTNMADEAAALFGRLEKGASVVRFACNAPPDFSSEAVLLLGSGVQDYVEASAESFTPAEQGNLLSDAEMKDILGGFETPLPPEPSAHHDAPGNLDMVLDIRLIATARLGRVELPLSEILELGPGSIIEVGHLVDEPVDLLINDKLIARGDVVVVDEKFGLRITEIVSPKERIESLR